MNISGDLKRKVLYQELLDTLRKYDKKTTREVTYSKIMNTKRRFRADFYCPELSLFVEVNGGQYVNGRHNRAGSYQEDLTKINTAQVNGFWVLQFTYEMLSKGDHIKIISDFVLNKQTSNNDTTD